MSRAERRRPRVAGTYRRVFAEARAYRPHIGALLALGVLASALTLLTPLPLTIAVDSGLGSHRPPGFLRVLGIGHSGTGVLLAAALLFVAIAVLNALQQLAVTVLSSWTGERLVLEFRGRLFRHVQQLSFAYHDAQGTSDSTYRIQWDAPSMQHIAIDGVLPFLTAGLTVVGMIYVTALIDWRLALVSLSVVPVLLALFVVYSARMRQSWHETKALESSALSVVHEALGALRVVKAFGQEGREHRRFASRSARSVRARVRLSAIEGMFGLLVGTTVAIGTAAVLYVGIRRVQARAITLGELLLVMGYLTQLYEPLRTIAQKAGDLQSSVAGAERCFALLDLVPEPRERPDPRPLRRARGEIWFDRVSFAYDREPVLRDVSVHVAAGSRVGIAGPTGAGKSTLVGLLTRFYDPTEGRILLDGVDLREHRLADLRQQFAIVLQEPVLFSTSIAENIAYGRAGARREEIEAAARAADAHDFVSALPDGYDTPVGERGMRLSGGERQRVSLARAFLKDAPILILDEPTSSIDMRTEANIMEAIERLMRGRTTLMIAHRLSTLEGCDIRLEIDLGRVRTVTPAPSLGRFAGAPA